MAQLSQPDKHDRCVNSARTALFTWAPISAAGTWAAWYGAAQASPAIAKVNWRVKGIASSVFVIAFSYYRAERAMIDCTQEYKERELEKMRARRDNINKGRTDE